MHQYEMALKKLVKREQVVDLFNLIDADFGIKDLFGDWVGQWRPQSYERELTILFDESIAAHVVGSGNLEAVQRLAECFLGYELEKRALADTTLSSYKELNLFYRLSQKMRSCVGFDDIARLTLQEVADLLRAGQASVMRVNDDKTLELVANIGRQSDRRSKLKAGQGVAGHVVSTGEPELVLAAEADPRFVDNGFDVKSLICVPLKMEDKVVGLLNISSQQEKAFSAQDLKVAVAVATQAGAAVENTFLQQRRLEQDRIRRHLQRYVSSHVVDQIMAQDDDNPLGTIRTTITCLFADIRNFTSLCEKLPPQQMVNHLNTYFSRMVDLLFMKQGTLNKFVGDMIFAFFNAPNALEEHERRGVETAILMQEAMQTIDDPWIRENFKIGIGLTSGPAVVGNIGAETHCDYTAIGDTVNTGARLQAMAKGGEILVSPMVYEATSALFKYRSRGMVSVKGRTEDIEVFEVIY